MPNMPFKEKKQWKNVNLWFSPLSRKYCRHCGAKASRGTPMTWGEYTSNRYRTIADFCANCFVAQVESVLRTAVPHSKLVATVCMRSGGPITHYPILLCLQTLLTKLAEEGQRNGKV